MAMRLVHINMRFAPCIKRKFKTATLLHNTALATTKKQAISSLGRVPNRYDVQEGDARMPTIAAVLARTTKKLNFLFQHK